MKGVREGKAREHRIDMEVIVDACDKTERAMGWHCYPQDKLTFSFKAKCVGNVYFTALRG